MISAQHPNPYRGVHWWRRIPIPLADPREVLADSLEESFKRRACFTCGAHWWCQHREPEVEAAILDSARNRATAARKVGI